ncbi:tRNA adenosine deaminase-associated protein [Yinghuangia soli]|uniref:tRNA adenosine deaminase-associated protein n=1 Tax=Yinghuangia soli TaxID=2908204 RepID=UPI001F203176|nr:tRNA adenosine deaminase-associated protein [Yinghuangia soli]
MAYFAAVLVRTEQQWEAQEVDLDDVDDLDGIADLARASSVDEEPVLLLVEQEDTWFAVIRVDGEEDPRIYVSDAAAVARSAYGDTLLTADVLGHDPDDEEEAPPTGPAGDETVLADLGVHPDELADLGSGGKMPADALIMIAERLGCADELETVR